MLWEQYALTVLKCLSLLLVFLGKVVYFCLMLFNAFSLFSFSWSHLESLEMCQKHSLTPEMSALSCLLFCVCYHFPLELAVLKAFYFHLFFFFWLCSIFVLATKSFKNSCTTCWDSKNDYWWINLTASGIILWRVWNMFQQQHK